MHLRSTTKNLPLLALFCVHSHQRSHLLFSPLLCCGGFPILSLPYSLLSATCSFLCFQHWFSASPIHFCFYLICSQRGWQQLFILNHPLSLQSTSVLVSPHFCVLLGPDLCYFNEPQSSEALGDQGENTHRNLDTHTQKNAGTQDCAHSNTKYAQNTRCSLEHFVTSANIMLSKMSNIDLLNQNLSFCKNSKLFHNKKRSDKCSYGYLNCTISWAHLAPLFYALYATFNGADVPLECSCYLEFTGPTFWHCAILQHETWFCLSIFWLPESKSFSRPYMVYKKNSSAVEHFNFVHIPKHI